MAEVFLAVYVLGAAASLLFLIWINEDQWRWPSSGSKEAKVLASFELLFAACGVLIWPVSFLFLTVWAMAKIEAREGGLRDMPPSDAPDR